MADNASSPASGIAPTTANHNATPRRPSLCMKPMPAPLVAATTTNVTSPGASTGAGSPPLSLTSKEWIVPPRPKPGRKPATDTPPTKRKAQNRAAQRAFRERRAARVGELEEQMKEVEDQHEQEQEQLRSNVIALERSLEQCQHDLVNWMSKCQSLETELRQTQEQLLTTSHRSHKRDQPVERGSAVVGCGNCTLESRCQCVDDVVKGFDNDGRSNTQQHIHDDVQHRQIKVEATEFNALEIDFTTAFSKPASSASRIQNSTIILDPCGFCQDGTPCICAEMAADQEHQVATRQGSPIMHQQLDRRHIAQFTPPPSDTDVSMSNTAPARCASGPGTCTQCLTDPNSTLFCKSLAASRGVSSSSGGCCGAKGADGGCCQSSVPLPPRNTRLRTMNSNMTLPAPTNTRSPITLSCADAYTALSRHAAYDQASGDMASWMPKLHAKTPAVEGRPAMEIDAANVMAVLKDFDRRFAASK